MRRTSARSMYSGRSRVAASLSSSVSSTGSGTGRAVFTSTTAIEHQPGALEIEYPRGFVPGHLRVVHTCGIWRGNEQDVLGGSQRRGADH